MAARISWTLNVQVAGGPNLPSGQTIDVEAYDVIQVALPGGDTATPGKATVDVQPGGSGQVKFLMIISSAYDSKLTYKVDGGTEIKLDAPHFFVGDGSVGLLGATQHQFAFRNQAGVNKPASIQVLVGRKATT